MKSGVKAALISVAAYLFVSCAVKPLPQASVEKEAWIYVVGQVKRNGKFQTAGESGSTLSHVINQAGGFTEQASLKRIRVYDNNTTNVYNFWLIQRGERPDPLVPAGATVAVWRNSFF